MKSYLTLGLMALIATANLSTTLAPVSGMTSSASRSIASAEDGPAGLIARLGDLSDAQALAGINLLRSIELDPVAMSALEKYFAQLLQSEKSHAVDLRSAVALKLLETPDKVGSETLKLVSESNQLDGEFKEMAEIEINRRATEPSLHGQSSGEIGRRFEGTKYSNLKLKLPQSDGTNVIEMRSYLARNRGTAACHAIFN